MISPDDDPVRTKDDDMKLAIDTHEISSSPVENASLRLNDLPFHLHDVVQSTVSAEQRAAALSQVRLDLPRFPG
jgi:hypothetical protein